jgi:methionyl-tRNA formyltransferase
MAGDAETGVMVMKMDVGLDTGDVAMAERLAITDCMTAPICMSAGAARRRSDGAGDRRAGARLAATDEAERGGVTYAAKIEKAEARIDWSKPARGVLRHIHGLSPFPGAWSEVEIDGEAARLKFLRCELAKRRGRTGRRARRPSSRLPAAKARSGFWTCSAPARPDEDGGVLRGTR